MLFSTEELKTLSHQFNLYIISSNGEEVIEAFLSHHGLTSHFKRILGANFHKSKVLKFEYLFSEFNLKPEECIFVTDTLGDILEGTKVGVKTIAVDFGFHDRVRLNKGNPFKIISSSSELLSILETL